MPTSNTNNVTNNNVNGGNNMNNNTPFSMNDLANAIAAAMVVAQNANTQSTPQATVTNGDVTIPAGYIFAKNSQFYGKVMADGQIYNPYLVRRFLPSQFMGLIKKYDGNVDKGIKKECNYPYMLKWVINEVNKLAYLEKKDPIAFAERKCFMDIARVQLIMNDYCDQLEKALARSKEEYRAKYIGVNFKGKLPGGYTFNKGKYKEEIQFHKVIKVLEKSGEYTEILNRIKHFKKDIKDARTYEQLAKVVNGFKFIKLKNGKLCYSMIEAYKASGAYYTLKNLILFDGVNFSSTTDGCYNNPTDSARALNGIKNKEAYVIYAILKKSMEDSGYTIQ